jgi:glycosyltransferase involved in cell wall biosynthesis
MRILMFGWEFPPNNSGGLGTACYGLTKGLSKKGVNITFVLPRKMKVNADYVKVVFPEGSNECILVNSALIAYSTIDSYASRVFPDDENNSSMYGSNLFAEVERYGLIGRQIASRENFDVIHAHDWLTFKAAIEAKKISGKYLVVHIHATEFDRTGGNGVNQYVYDLEKQGMEEADAVVAVSNYTKKKIIEHYGIAPEKIKVVHNGVEFENYALEKVNKLRDHNKIVLFLGRITLQKGPDYFVETAKKVIDFYPNAIFVVAGSGDMEKQMIKQVANLGIADRFIFTGFLRGKEVYEAYKMADLYVMPSVSEPFGIAPLESLNQGTPVLISKQSGVSEVLTNALKADFWDTDEMANKIVSVLKHDELKRTLQENGSREANTLSWETPAQRIVDIYRDLMERK